MAGKRRLQACLVGAIALLGAMPGAAHAQYYGGGYEQVSYGPAPGHADYLGRLSINDRCIGLSTRGDFRVQVVDAFRSAGYRVDCDTQRIVVYFNGYAPRVHWTGGQWNLRIDRCGDTLVLVPVGGHVYERRAEILPYPAPVVVAPAYCPPTPVVCPPPVVVSRPVVVTRPTYCPPTYRPPTYCPPTYRTYSSGPSIHFSIGNSGYRGPAYCPPSRGHDWGRGGWDRRDDHRGGRDWGHNRGGHDRGGNDRGNRRGR